jgi:2-polyprenyl-6-methoxyphenol hydroxylase-like FAD-dependent oxidoreductase
VSSPLDALIVGAGPVGLTMAAELSRHGLRCRLIDKSPTATDKSKALVLWSRSLELLAGAGAVEPFLAAGMRVLRAGLHRGSERLAEVTFDGLPTPYPFALMIPQSETERLLALHLERLGGTVERGVELVEFRAESDAISARVRDARGGEERMQAAWLIGCDGAHSTVRHQLGIDFGGAAEPNDWILADVRIDGNVAPEVGIYWHAEGILALFPITPGRFRVVADSGPAAPTERPRDPSLAEVQAVVDARGPGGLTVHDPYWLAGFRINERKVADYRVGRVFLAGDAAHIHSPAGGQGMNTGMQDAFNLAWKLTLAHRGGAHGDLLLDSYSRERSAVGDEVLRNAGAMTRIATLRRPTAQHLRNSLLPMLASLGFVQRRLRETLTELGISYRGSPLSHDDRSLPARALAPVLAGDRAPDVGLVDAQSGAETTLFARFGTRYCLLLCDDAAAGNTELQATAAAVRAAYADLIEAYIVAPAGAAGAVPLLLDHGGAMHAAYGVRGPTGILVRPDGYIGYYGQPLDGDSLLAHLASYLRASASPR